MKLLSAIGLAMEILVVCLLCPPRQQCVLCELHAAYMYNKELEAIEYAKPDHEIAMQAMTAAPRAPLLCATFMKASSIASSVLLTNIELTRNNCEWALVVYKGTEADVDSLCNTAQIKDRLVHCRRSPDSYLPMNSSALSIPKSVLYQDLLGVLPGYEKVFLMDEDISLIDFNIKLFMSIWDCFPSLEYPYSSQKQQQWPQQQQEQMKSRQWRKPIIQPLIVQPIIAESTQGARFLNQKFWSHDSKEWNDVMMTTVGFVEQQVPMLDSIFFEWFIRRVLSQTKAVASQEGVDWGFDRTWCNAALMYGVAVLGWPELKSLQHSSSNGGAVGGGSISESNDTTMISSHTTSTFGLSQGCGLVTAPGTSVHHLDRKTMKAIHNSETSLLQSRASTITSLYQHLFPSWVKKDVNGPCCNPKEVKPFDSFKQARSGDILTSCDMIGDGDGDGDFGNHAALLHKHLLHRVERTAPWKGHQLDTMNYNKEVDVVGLAYRDYYQPQEIRHKTGPQQFQSTNSSTKSSIDSGEIDGDGDDEGDRDAVTYLGARKALLCATFINLCEYQNSTSPSIARTNATASTSTTETSTYKTTLWNQSSVGPPPSEATDPAKILRFNLPAMDRHCDWAVIFVGSPDKDDISAEVDSQTTSTSKPQFLRSDSTYGETDFNSRTSMIVEHICAELAQLPLLISAIAYCNLTVQRRTASTYFNHRDDDSSNQYSNSYSYNDNSAHPAGVPSPRSLLFRDLLPLLPHYEKIFLVDEDVSLTQFNYTMFHRVTSSGFPARYGGGPLIAQPLIYEEGTPSSQSPMNSIPEPSKHASYLTVEAWAAAGSGSTAVAQQVDGTKQQQPRPMGELDLSDVLASTVGYIEQQAVVLDSIFFHWIISRVLTEVTTCATPSPLPSPSAPIVDSASAFTTSSSSVGAGIMWDVDWGLERSWCRAAQMYSEEVLFWPLESISTLSPACAVVTAPGTAVQHWNTIAAHEHETRDKARYAHDSTQLYEELFPTWVVLDPAVDELNPLLWKKNKDRFRMVREMDISSHGR